MMHRLPALFSTILWASEICSKGKNVFTIGFNFFSDISLQRERQSDQEPEILPNSAVKQGKEDS